jgi:hypothetical protein
MYFHVVSAGLEMSKVKPPATLPELDDPAFVKVQGIT